MYSLDVAGYYGPTMIVFTCKGGDNQRWIWNATDSTVRSRFNEACLTLQQELEVWAGPLLGGSQAVLLLNRADSGSEEMTVKWSDIGFPVDHPAVVRDLWAHKDIGIFTGSYTSPNIDSHAVMMLNITLTK
jgi:hypothetical protein